MIKDDYEVLFSRSSPVESRVVVDKMPEELSWVLMVDRLACGDITKHESVYKLNYIQCLQLMTAWYYKDKQIEQHNRIQARKNN